MNDSEIWNYDEPISELGIDVPRWIDQDITGTDVAAICQGGCASGAYMPAVTYREAAETMAKEGDDVLDYIIDVCGELPTISTDTSWGQIACTFLSLAVELWANGAYSEMEDLDIETEEEA